MERVRNGQALAEYGGKEKEAELWVYAGVFRLCLSCADSWKARQTAAAFFVGSAFWLLIVSTIPNLRYRSTIHHARETDTPSASDTSDTVVDGI